MKEKISQKIEKGFREIFGILPTLEELQANFPHKQGCKQLTVLERTEKTEDVSVYGAGIYDPSVISVTKKLLECSTCHVQARFAE